MQKRKLNAERAWKRLEDVLVPRLRLTVKERSAYSHLFRHTRLEGRRRSCLSISWLARALRLNTTTARRALRSLAGKGALRILARTYRGHMIEIFSPDEVGARHTVPPASPVRLDTLDFLARRDLRDAIHRREAGRCFYCLREVPRPQRSLDHVVPEVSNGSNSYRNLVSCCHNCNVRKSGRLAADYIRALYRMRRLNAGEFAQRLRALQALIRGKLKPVLSPSSFEKMLPRPRGPRRGRLQMRW